MQTGDEVTHPQWGRGTVLFDKEHCIGVRFVEHGQVNFSQEEWKAQKSPPSRFRSTPELEYSLQEAVENMELTEDEASRLLQSNAHPMEVQRLRRPSLVMAYQRYADNPKDKFVEDDFYTVLLGYITAMVKRSCHDQFTFANIEDAIQESALEVWQRLSEFQRAKSPFPSWVALITLHNVRDALRRFKTSHGGPQRPDVESPKVVQFEEEQVAAMGMPMDEQMALKEFVGRLSALDRSIVKMSTDGLTLREIGAALNMSYESVRIRLKKLKLKFDK